jgi:hypothetical protein
MSVFLEWRSNFHGELEIQLHGKLHDTVSIVEMKRQSTKKGCFFMKGFYFIENMKKVLASTKFVCGHIIIK